MAAKKKFTIAQVLEALIVSGGVRFQAAHILGCHRKTVEKYVKNSKTLQAFCAGYEDRVLDLAEFGAFRILMNPDHPKYATMIIFVLKYRGKGRGWIDSAELNLNTTQESQEAKDLLDELKKQIKKNDPRTLKFTPPKPKD